MTHSNWNLLRLRNALAMKIQNYTARYKTSLMSFSSSWHNPLEGYLKLYSVA